MTRSKDTSPNTLPSPPLKDVSVPFWLGSGTVKLSPGLRIKQNGIHNIFWKVLLPKVSKYVVTSKYWFDSWMLIDCLLNESRKTKAKVITTTNQKKGQYTEEPMTTQGKNNETTRRAGKHARPSRDWFKFCIWLVEKEVKQNPSIPGLLSTLWIWLQWTKDFPSHNKKD